MDDVDYRDLARTMIFSIIRTLTDPEMVELFAEKLKEKMEKEGEEE